MMFSWGYKMLDKLNLTAPKSDQTKENACKLLQGQYQYTSMEVSKYHHEVIVFHLSRVKGDTLLSLHLRPRYSNGPAIIIEMNPAKFNSYSAMNKIINELTDPEELTITRVDHSVDVIGHSVDEINSKLIYSRKKSTEIRKNSVELETLYLGNKPERIMIYNKSLQAGLGADLKTRIEVQQYRAKVAIKSYRNLADYQSFEPFSNLKFLSVKTDLTEPLDKKNSDWIRANINKYGAQGAFKNLNRHSNFKRNYGHLFKVDTDIPNLNLIYQNNLKKFFKGDTNGI